MHFGIDLGMSPMNMGFVEPSNAPHVNARSFKGIIVEDIVYAWNEPDRVSVSYASHKIDSADKLVNESYNCSCSNFTLFIWPSLPSPRYKRK